ncbi:putative colanic acid biosysnthesis UDP-glucose lipid carrier transferase [Kaistella treverensis]|uniref:Putative colanic acid biosysnthesis UDP-glucose lipid carrier transferase n=1 Tax=Kaistella treverensis TaxID=631455 RepID=A0A1I3LPQ2_9FLAO|nr:exopolysaccharide biosynthesis polyprenyl glycosylphosphotransferase [Kaistella treverensis]SFI86456.1 putative colanic acid biosysnthesis UDP-glucose lipid carrier transferase [Kaistella treverensis]
MQKIRYSRYFRLVFILLDILVISAVFIYFYLKNYRELFAEFTSEQNILSITLLILFWILLSGRTKLYSVPRTITYTLYLERLVTHILLFIFGVVLLAKVSNNDFLKQDRAWMGLSLFFILFFLKSAIFFALKYIRTLGWNYRNIMFLVDDTSAKMLKTILNERKDYGFRNWEYPPRENINLQNLVSFWRKNGIHTMYLSAESAELYRDKEDEIYELAEKYQVRISLIPSVINNFFEFDLSYIETQPVFVRVKFPLDNLVNSLIKRTFDLLFSALVLLFICSWLFPIIAVMIKMGDKGPIFFVQKRYGFHDRIFNCIKFRSMRVNGECTTKTTAPDDDRITKIGRFLRRTSLDEMPQFFNVLKGEMSVVGPRPHMLLIDDFYKPKIGRYSVRSLVKPGISGLAQVNGLRGDNGDMEIAMQKRILADNFYVKKWTMSLDIVIIIKTIILLIAGDKNAR